MRATQQRTKFSPAPRDLNGVLSHLLFEDDLRIEVVAQGVILKDEEQMGKIRELSETIEKWLTYESIRDDLEKPQNS